MTVTTIVGSRKSLYESPLAEEIFVSFEENILSGNGNGTTKSTLDGWVTGNDGYTGNPNDFDGGSTDLL